MLKNKKPPVKRLTEGNNFITHGYLFENESVKSGVYGNRTRVLNILQCFLHV
jgi:hypothetical protein